MLVINHDEVSVPVAAKALGVSRPTAYRWIGLGYLTAWKRGGQYFVKLASIAELRLRRKRDAQLMQSADA